MSYAYLNIDGEDVQITDAKITYQQNAIGEWQATIPYKYIVGKDLFALPVSLRFQDRILVTGIVSDKEAEISMNQESLVLATVYCWDELGSLHCEGALSDAHYQDERVRDIISDLLDANTTSWQLGDTSTYVNQRTTIDLRSMEGRWAQVVEMVTSVPDTSVRYGGFNTGTGRQMLDVGGFGASHTEGVIQDRNLIEITRNKTTNERLRRIEGFGGKSGEEVITLQRALNYQPSLATDPNFPIINVGGYFFVQNNAITNGCVRRRDYDLHKTENEEPPTEAELNEAGYALYQHIVRDLKKNVKYESYTVRCTLEDPAPLIGDKILVKGSVKEIIYDQNTEREILVETFSIGNEFFVTKVDIEFADGLLVYTLEVTDTPYMDTYDSDIQVYEQTAKPNEKLDTARAITGLTLMYSAVTQGPGVASDCINPGDPPIDGRLFNIPVPNAPGNPTDLTYVINMTPAVAEYRLVQAPDLAGDNLIICVNVAADWTLLSTATVRVQWTFIY